MAVVIVISAIRFLTLASGIFLGASFILMEKERAVKMRKLFIGASPLLLAAVLFGEPGIQTWLQYNTWAKNPAARYFLPPYQPWSYFLGYAGFRFWLWRGIGAGIAALFYFLMQRFIVRPSSGFRMNRQEAFLVSFGIALAGWPFLLVYIAAFFFCYTILLTIVQLRSGKNARFPVALPATAALFVIPFANTIIESVGLTVLRVSTQSV